MFLLFQKNPLFHPSRCSSSSSQVRNFLIRFPVSWLSPPPPQPHRNRLEDDKVRVSVWWDFDNCAVPSGVSYLKVAPSIMGALRTHGIKCPVDIEAYGNLSQLSEFNQEELFLTGINLHHVPEGRMHAYRYLLDWGFKNPAPAHLFIISGDRDIDFVGAVSQLRMRSYNIFLACPVKTDFILCHTATIMWPWSSMLKGDFTGKYFNNPPKWSGLKVPLENPFSFAVKPTSSQNVEIHKPSSDSKLDGEVPELVSQQVRKILRLYPNGISIGDLQAKLTNCDLPLDERFYEHENFSDFLVSIPNVQLLDKGEDNFCALLIPSDNDIVRSEDISPEILDKNPTSQNRIICNDYVVLKNNDIGNCESGKVENKHENPARKKVNEVCRSSYSSLVEEKRRDESAETSSRSSTCWISSWWTFWKTNAKLFSADSFWGAMESTDKVRVSVWWDFDNCVKPSNFSVSKIAPSIVGALRTNGINGPVDFRGYGDVSQFSKFEKIALSLTGFRLHHITDEMKKRKWNRACDYLFLELNRWVFENPPPVHLFIICGCGGVNGASVLHRLRMENYNILVASPGMTFDDLRGATTIMWHWSSILKGENLTGKHLNYPPDGPLNSWYGDSMRSPHLH